MGFFDLKVTCSICNKETGLNRYRIADKGWICPECLKKCGFGLGTPIRQKTVEDIHRAMENEKIRLEELNSFTATKKIGTHMEIDENQKKWLIPDGMFGGKKKPKIHNFSEIVDFELLEDGESIVKGGIGKAVIGGALFGGVGAIVGGSTGKKKSKPVCTNLRIKITLNDINNPVAYIDFIKTATKKDGIIYKSLYNSAQECLSVLQLITSSQETLQEENISPEASSADEILKFKNLLDQGIISEEEFEAKKKQLLGL